MKLKRLRYVCYGKSRKQTDCHGQTGYSAKRIDDIVDGVIRHVFSSMKSIPKNEVVQSGMASTQKEYASRYKTAQRNLKKAVNDISELKGEVLNAIRGKSKFSPELLNELIAQSERTAKKMIVANLINRIEVGTDYQIHIDFNIDLSRFNIQLDICA